MLLLFIREKRKNWFKNKVSPYYFPSSGGENIENITKNSTKQTVFVYIFGFVFCGKTNLQIYDFSLCLAHFVNKITY